MEINGDRSVLRIPGRINRGGDDGDKTAAVCKCQGSPVLSVWGKTQQRWLPVLSVREGGSGGTWSVVSSVTSGASATFLLVCSAQRTQTSLERVCVCVCVVCCMCVCTHARIRICETGSRRFLDSGRTLGLTVEQGNLYPIWHDAMARTNRSKVSNFQCVFMVSIQRARTGFVLRCVPGTLDACNY